MNAQPITDIFDQCHIKEGDLYQFEVLPFDHYTSQLKELWIDKYIYLPNTEGFEEGLHAKIKDVYLREYLKADAMTNFTVKFRIGIKDDMEVTTTMFRSNGYNMKCLETFIFEDSIKDIEIVI